MNYFYSKEIEGDFKRVLEATIKSLESEGFGIITQIDVKKTMAQKINKQYDDYMILGACNPVYADKVLNIHKEIGLLLPCNVLVYKDVDKIVVSTILPTVLMRDINNKNLINIANEIEIKLKNAINNINI